MSHLTKQQTLDAVKANFEKVCPFIYTLRGRWADECAHEDFATYQLAIIEFFEKLGLTVTVVTRSFKLKFESGLTAQFYASGRVAYRG